MQHTRVLDRKLQMAKRARRFHRVRGTIAAFVSRSDADLLVAKAVAEVRATPAKRPGYAWSGGKDSQALRVVMERAGIEDAGIGLCTFEFECFLRFVEENAPLNLERSECVHGYEMLQEHPERLFGDGEWWARHNTANYKRWAEKAGLDVCFTGRRAIDGNNAKRTRSNGVAYHSPLWEWTHEEVLAVNRYYDMPQSPLYEWPTGFVIGTCLWPANRIDTDNLDEHWARLYRIDPATYYRARRELGMGTDLPPLDYDPDTRAFTPRA